MVGLHSSDPTSVFLSAWARVEGFTSADLEDALYGRRTLVRMLGMRRTLFVVPLDLAAVMDEACAMAYAPAERRRLTRMLEDQGVVAPSQGARWLRRVEAATLDALARRGEATARELTKEVPELGTKLLFGEGRTWAGQMGVSTRVLFLLATDAQVVRARPLGSWVSGQYRWARTESWLGGPFSRIGKAQACADLLERYLRAFGPATLTDVRWWTGWSARLATATLEALGAVEIRLDEGTGYVLPGDLRTEAAMDPWVAFLPGLDPTTMGWKERSWYLGDHDQLLFDRAGNAGPTVWANGRIVGGWTQARDGEILVRLLERVDARTRRRIAAERERLRSWLGDVRFRTRARSPHERILTGD